MERLKLELSARDGRGKSATRKLRAQGRVPGIVYGAGISPTPVTAESLALARIARGGANALVDLLGVAAVEGKPVLLKELQRDPVTRRHVHFDLFAVDLSAQTITRGNRLFSFAIDPVSRNQLLNGWDDIDLTESYRGRITAFKAADRQRRPWVQPAKP